MDNILPYVIGAIIILGVIILNRKRQKNSVDNFLKDAKEVQPIFLVQSVEKKLKSLYAVLYEGDSAQGVAISAKIAGRKAVLVQELEQLEKAYSEKKISLSVYSNKLQALQLKVNEFL